MKTRQVTGAVFDPFAINSAGIMRNLQISKSDLESGMGMKLHKEAKFKKMLITCCNFAESITLVGPLTQLNFDSADSKSSLVDPAIDWVADPCIGENKEYFEAIKRLLTEASKTKGWSVGNLQMITNQFTTPEGSTKYLSVMPDLSFSVDQSRKGQYSSYEITKKRTIFGDRSSLEMTTPDGSVRECGRPYVGLMAVIFSFKKVNGHLGSTENTNLGGWPPMVFLIPSMVPSGAFVQTDTRYRSGMYVFQAQPAIAAYTIHNPPGRDADRTGITTFGNPFRLATVNTQGKVPDTLRTLSDTLSDLWTEATIYSAVNMNVDIIGDKSKGEYAPGKLNLEPMGLGRRIRGHNRFSGIYDFSEFEAIFQVNAYGHNTILDEAFSAKMQHVGSIARHNLQAVSYITSTSFVFPSYINNPKDFKPVMLALQDWMVGTGDTPLRSFINPKKCSGLYPWTEALGAASKEEGGLEASLDASGRSELFNIGVEDYRRAFNFRENGLSKNEDEKSLLYGTDTMLGYSSSGDPSILGVSAPRYAISAMAQDFESGDVTAKEASESRVAKSSFQEGFKYAEELVGGEGAIKKMFKEKKVKSGKKSQGISFTNDDDFVTLFDQDDDLI